jgi:hypothetical protein
MISQNTGTKTKLWFPVTPSIVSNEWKQAKSRQ